MSAGPMCIDVNVNEKDVKTSDPETWQVCWFDHEEFDWEPVEYVDEDGVITGDKIMPDFKTFIDVYYYGRFDDIYEKQLIEDGKELPNKSKWCEKELC